MYCAEIARFTVLTVKTKRRYTAGLFQNFKTSFPRNNESMVSLVSRCYMRGENGTESLVVCLSEYVTLRSVFTLLIAV